MFCTDIIWLHIHVTNSSIVLTLVSCCLWWRPPVSGTVPPASSSSGTPHRVPRSVSEGEEGHTEGHTGYPATEINSLQQCHSAKQAAGIPETTWYVQQQRGVADYTCSPLSWSCSCYSRTHHLLLQVPATPLVTRWSQSWTNLTHTRLWQRPQPIFAKKSERPAKNE